MSVGIIKTIKRAFLHSLELDGVDGVSIYPKFFHLRSRLHEEAPCKAPPELIPAGLTQERLWELNQPWWGVRITTKEELTDTFVMNVAEFIKIFDRPPTMHFAYDYDKNRVEMQFRGRVQQENAYITIILPVQ